jgi:hypothetical protein
MPFMPQKPAVLVLRSLAFSLAVGAIAVCAARTDFGHVRIGQGETLVSESGRSTLPSIDCPGTGPEPMQLASTAAGMDRAEWSSDVRFISIALGAAASAVQASNPPASTPPATQPATQPATRPATVPATQPATVPAVPNDVVRGLRLDLEFPAVGNVEGVKTWRLGRVDRVDTIANSSDIFVSFRTGDGSVIRTRGPAGPLDALARASNWLQSPVRSTPGRADYIERMVAFDVDADGRLIAVASLEPVARNRNRLRSALMR